MANKENYVQCDMKDQDWHVHTAWIPKSFAKVNKKIRIDSYYPDTIWTIIACWESKDAEFVESHARDYKNAYPSIQEI